MQTIYDYFYRSNGQHDFRKAYRETLIFQMINTFDKQHTPDDGVKGDAMTILQKRRLRNDIVRHAVSYAESHRDASVYDTDVIVNAFFETDFGKKFANQREQFEENEKQNMVDTVSSWTIGQPEDGVLRFTVSPYDPNFVDSDMFDDEHDQIGYMVGERRYIYTDNNNMQRRHTGLSRGTITNDTKYTPIYADGKVVSGYVSHVNLGENGMVEPCTPETLNKFGDLSKMRRIYKDSTLFSGYNEISDYIKSNDNAERVRKYFEQDFERKTADEENKFKNLMTDDQKKFMRDVCQWLSNKGITFDIDTTGGNTNERVVARLDDGKMITLYNAHWPRAQGEISDNRITASVYIDTLSKPEDGVDINNLITSEDRLNAIKWYFGEAVDMQVRLSDSFKTGIGNRNAELLTDTYNSTSVGTQGEVPVMRIAGSTIRNNPQATSPKVTSGSGDNTSVILSAADYNGTMYTIRCKLDNSRQVGIYKKQISSLTDYVFDNDGRRAGDIILNSLDRSNIYPDDLEDIVMYVDDMAIETEQVIDDIPQDHRDYYRQATVNALLSRWVDSAKDTYRQMFDMDKLIEEHNNRQTDESNTEENNAPAFNGDEDIATLQKFYWDVLSGVRLSGKAKNRDSDAVDGIETFDNDVYDMSYEDRVEAVREHFERHIEDMFGRVPEMRKPFLSDEENAAIDERNKTAGFNPVSVAKYANTDVSGNTLQNYDYMLNMLTSLGDEYHAGYLKDGSHKAEEIRRSMIKYDEASAVNVKLIDILPYESEEEKRRASEDSNVMKTVMNRWLKGGQEVNNAVLENIYNTTGQLRNRPVTTDMLAYTMLSLAKTGCKPESIEVGVDEQGILRYKGIYDVGVVANKSSDVQGEIGQIFEPDEYGCIIPKFGDNGTSAKVYIPGYDAYLEINDKTNPKPRKDRLRLIDWQYRMKQAISSEIRESVTSNKTYYNFVPHTTDLNKIYGKAYNTQISVEEYYDNLNPELRSPEEVDTFISCIKTLQGRCRFPNEYGAGSTTEAQSMLDNPNTLASKSYNYYYSDLNDNENLRCLSGYQGIFDETATGTAKLQGIVLYLAEGVKVDSATGKVTAVPYDDFMNPPRCPLMKDKMMAGTEHDPWDRRLMASTQILTSLRTPRHVGVAMLNLKGDTFDDGFTVSKAFAEKYSIKSVDGKMRPLTAQDKLADKHGNKGVITRVVDPEQYSELMVNEVKVELGDGKDMYTAEYRGNKYEFKYFQDKTDRNGNFIPIEMQAVKAVQKQLHIDDDICKFFLDNPKLDIVASPYSGMSRFNGGTIRDLMSDPDTLNLKGKSIQGGMGYMDMIVVDMPADVKTHWYDVDTMREGKGRKASGQLLWVLDAKGADNIINEFYGRNDRAWDNLREYAIAIGLDLTEDLKPVVGYHEQTDRGEHRRLYSMPSDKDIEALRISKNGTIDKRSLSGFKNNSSFTKDINTAGGFMELPFQLKFDTLKYVKSRYTDVCEDWFKLKQTGSYQSGGEEKPTYGLPLLPPNLIKGQETQDGVMLLNDRVKDYINIYMEAAQYRRYEMELQNCKNEDKEKFIKSMELCQNKAQIYFNNIVDDVISKHFDTKHNVIRDQCMASRIASSATAVIAAGIDLKSDEVAMSRDHAVKLGLMEYDKDKDEYNWTNGKGGSVLVWRDPILRDGGVRYMNVVIDDSVMGVRINPAMDKSFDGDFDGDTFGIVALKTKAAQAQAYEKFHVSNNLLDLGSKDSETGRYPLFINSGMDMTAIMAADKTGRLKAMYKSIEDNANEMQAAVEKIEAGLMDAEDYKYTMTVKRDGKKEEVTYTGQKAISMCKKDCKHKLDVFLSRAFNDIGTDHIVVENPQTVVQSFNHIVESGAKGNAGSMKNLMDNIGIEYEVDADGKADSQTARNITCVVNGKERICPRVMKDSAESGENKMQEADRQSQEAAAYKADNTQLGGVTAQEAVAAFRNYCLAKVLASTYPITQGILGSKHDAEDAIAKDGIVRFWGKDVWNGYKLTGNWNETDPAAIRAEKHERICKYALDGNGEKIPMMERDENGQYVEKRNDKGEIMYEMYHEKCTKDEWVAQMKGMMTALKVDINEDYIRDIADIMTHTQPTPVFRCDTRLPITSYDPVMKERSYVTGKSNEVYGVDEFARLNGSLLDQVAYKGRIKAFTDAALRNTPLYRVQCDQNAKPAGSLVEMSANVERAEYIEEAKKKGFDSPEGQQALKNANYARDDISPDSMFVPKGIIEGLRQDKAYRNGISEKNEAKPIGSKANMVSEDDNVRFMGESMSEYEKRMSEQQAQANGVSADAENVTEEKGNVDMPVISSGFMEYDSNYERLETVNPFQEKLTAMQLSAQETMPVPERSKANNAIAVNDKINDNELIPF